MAPLATAAAQAKPAAVPATASRTVTFNGDVAVASRNGYQRVVAGPDYAQFASLHQPTFAFE
jgi:hypothetical protein